MSTSNFKKLFVSFDSQTAIFIVVCQAGGIKKIVKKLLPLKKERQFWPLQYFQMNFNTQILILTGCSVGGGHGVGCLGQTVVQSSATIKVLLKEKVLPMGTPFHFCFNSFFLIYNNFYPEKRGINFARKFLGLIEHYCTVASKLCGLTVVLH